MRIYDTLRVALSAFPLFACEPSDCEPGMMEEFSINEPVTAEQLDKIMADRPLPEQETARCRDACRVVYNEIRGWDAGVIDTCTLSANPDGGGLVECAGTGWEHRCFHD